MSDYISREEALQFRLSVNASREANRVTVARGVAEAIAQYIKAIPAADVRPVVFCKDCKNYDTACCGDGFGWCDEFNRGMLDDCFCCFGERREGGTP